MSLALNQLSITEAAKRLRSKEVSARELTEACLDEIAKQNPELNCYIEVFTTAREAADAADQRLATNYNLSPLTGIPLSIKDNILIKGKVVSAASKILANYQASYDATAIARLRAAGAVFVGRTNMDDAAMGSSTESSAFGPTKNPHDVTRVPGGSSGGSAAAVAANLCLGALGSDTAGSIRQPASFCGVVGLKPTYGRVSRSGLIALASSLDVIGPITKSVADAELIFNTISGADPLDATSIEEPREPPKPKKIIGVPFDFLSAGVAPAVKENFMAGLKKLEHRGYTIEEISLPHLKYSLSCYYVLMPAEASSNLARYDGLRYGAYQSGANLLDDYQTTRGLGFGREVRRRILLGTYVLSAGYYDTYYGKAVGAKELIAKEIRETFKRVDAIAMPTAPSTAFRLGEKILDPLQMYLADIFTVPANLAGVPAISLPAGNDREGLPIGFQLMADRGREDVLFALGRQFLDEVT